MADVYDFIVVGAGTAGSVIASRLANATSKPKVLLLEAGGQNQDESLRHPDLRFGAVQTPGMSWGYKSVPQPQLDGREIQCPCGRGLGGSSAVNFCCWLIGHREDFNTWADLVGDDAWKWEGQGGVKQRFRKIEAVHDNLDERQDKIVSKDAIKQHSQEGKVDVSYNQVWAELEWLSFSAAREFGEPLNGDMNSGDPTGFGLAPTTYYKGLRTTGVTAYLSDCPENLTIITDSLVSRVLFDDSRTATGVETVHGKMYRASKEVIISAGGLTSPKVLLLSGVGPSAELEKFSIPVVHDLPSVGKNLIDHSCYATTTILLKGKEDVGTQEAKSMLNDPLQSVGVQLPMAWLSSSAAKTSKEFQDLSKEAQTHLQKVPSFEVIVANVLPIVPDEPLPPNAQIITFVVAVMNAQSTGSVTLSSADPSEPPNIDVGYLSHPYDRRVAIEALRTVIAYSKVPTFAAVTDHSVEGPKSDSDEDIFDHVKKSLSPVFHYGGTCRMGRKGDEKTVVDTDFKVLGLKGLRVADHSIVPLMVNNHTQSTAYLIGETAAEKIIAEYGL
ncbi:alcohol dehydrogenase [Hyphodiscus hymeniophilus]|uniref:Alcohol dehydrogenase n=1 Tax=Hyphodiscus hymeniophilus TaxID=353542 RepID=A0A9P6SKA8_9HELO|nr:alcohol dehydrogenase [Hyphodiscus hymeniophilus]